MTVSLWQTDLARPERTSELLIIGAGIAGLAAALEAQRRGVSTSVIDRGPIGGAASGRNAGFLMRGVADCYSRACRDLGAERARHICTLTEENLAYLRRVGIEQLPGYRALPSCILAMREDEFEELRESKDLLERDGFEVAWMDSGDDSVWSRPGGTRALGGLVNPNDAQVNPCQMLRLLADGLDAPPRLGCAALALEARDDGVAVLTSDGVVRAGRVLVCVNAYAGSLIPELKPIVTPRRGQMMALPSSDLRLDCSYYVNFGSEYLRQTPEGTIVIGGCRTRHADVEIGEADDTTDLVQGSIEAFARDLLGEIPTPIRRWSGTMGFSPDGLPLVGPVPGNLGRTGRVWFCGGFTGHGMSMGCRTAQIAVGAMLAGEPNPFPLARSV